MRIVGTSRGIVSRHARPTQDSATTPIVIGDLYSRADATSLFMSAQRSEGDTLLPGGDSDTRLPFRDVIGELRHAVAAAEALIPCTHIDPGDAT